MHPIALAHSQISATRSLRSSVRNSSSNVIYETNWQSAHFARLISIHCGHSFRGTAGTLHSNGLLWELGNISKSSSESASLALVPCVSIVSSV